jgi:hypothetical protein
MDMRIEFEGAMAKQLSSEGYSDFSIEMMFERGSDNEYRSIRVNGAYWGWQASRESLVFDRVSDELYGINSTEIVRCVNDEWCDMLKEQGITWK